MKKYLYLIISMIFCLFLTSCGSNTQEMYVQQEGLPRPDSIDAETGIAVLSFLPGEVEYERLYNTLLQNWWMTAEGTPDSIESSELMPSEGLHALKTKNWRTYRRGDDNYVIFRYEDGLAWTDFEGKNISVSAVFFLIPKYAEECDHIMGYFSASESGDIGINEGMYTFYYPSEMTEGFFHWLMHGE